MCIRDSADAEPLFGDTGSFTDDGDIVPLSDVVLPSCGVGSDAATLCDDVFISPFVDIDVLSLTDGTVPVFPDEFDVVAVSDRDVPELFVVSAVAPISDDVVSLPLIGADVPGVFCGPDVVDEVMMFVPALAAVWLPAFHLPGAAVFCRRGRQPRYRA